MTLYLKDTTYIDWKTLAFESGHLAVDDGDDGGIRFLKVLPPEDERGADDRELNCSRRLVTKSFGCGHHHIYSALARGMPAPSKIPCNFSEILQYIWWNLDKSLDTEMIEASALVSALYCAKNGVTFVIDHHASPFAIENSLETIANAFDRVGISHLLCYEISDRDGDGPKEKGLQETDTFLSSGRQGHVGLHASFTVGADLLTRAVALAQKHNTGLHVHVAEDAVDQESCLKHYHKRVVERYAEAGVLDLPKSLLSHCIHLDEKERDLIRRSDVYVVQNTESNLNNNVGVANYRELGENIILGTDGIHSDMLRSAKAAFLAGQATEGLDFAGVYNRFRKIHEYIDGNGFGGDGDNNLVILDYDSPTDINESNFLGHFVFGFDARHVDSVISSGKLIVENKKLLTVAEDEILAFSREMGKKLWAKMQKLK
ncbi:MAG: amidohydrolase family protein [Deltaproteobacteria bacterium]|jgi:cytosine/adenosine deaminase-related metal-dependent hydrolase|nr:amidohydrolase family protein [Deltaproteobacteria bacterium]